MVEYLQTLQEIFLAEDRYLYILNGLGFSVGVTLFAAILGILLGILLALMKLSKSTILSKIALLYIDIVRGTPAVVQLMILANIVDRKSTRLNSSHANISYAVFCLK